MKYQYYKSFSNDLPDSLLDWVKSSLINDAHNDFKKRGLKSIKRFPFRTGIINDDFIRNIKTIVIAFEVFKKPRFIK